MLRADQRDFAIDEKAIDYLFPTQDTWDKIVVALNYADKLEHTGGKDSSELEDVLGRKMEIISNYSPLIHIEYFPVAPILVTRLKIY